MSSRRQVYAGRIPIGGGAPVSIQGMTRTRTTDVIATARQVQALVAAGCDIVRVALPTLADVDAVAALRREIGVIPLVADVHFDHRIAIAAAPFVDKVRLNPGTLRSDADVAEVVRALSDRGIPLRIGANAGSLPPSLRKDPRPLAERLCLAAEDLVERFVRHGFEQLVIAVKASDAMDTVTACRLAAARFDYPLHIGVTEAGTGREGTIQSSVALGILLDQGIGDTMRVSLAADPIEEVRVGRAILAALGRIKTPRLKACPACGRAHMDVAAVASRIEQWLALLPTPLRIAVMGCEVNGPGEAGDADWALVATPTGAALYREGRVLARGSLEAIEARLRTELGQGPAG